MSDPTPKLTELKAKREEIVEMNTFMALLSREPRLTVHMVDLDEGDDLGGPKSVSSRMFSRLLQEYFLEHFKLNRAAVIEAVRERADRELMQLQAAAKLEYKQLIGDAFDEPEAPPKKKK